MTARGSDSGVVLVNVLVVLAIAGGLMLLLVSSQEAALDRAARAADAALVEQIALGAEASVVDALRRDLDDAPEADHLAEPWAQGVIQQEVILPTGRFSVAVTDMQGRFDINQLAAPSPGLLDFARRLMVALDLPPATAEQIARVVSATGPVDALDDLAGFGVSDDALAAMEPHVTALPVPGTINLNSASPLLLGVMLQNSSLTAQALRLREGRGFLTLDDLTRIGAQRPQNSGFTSNVFVVDVVAEAGQARMVLQTRVIRRNDRGVKSVAVWERRLRQDAPPSP